MTLDDLIPLVKSTLIAPAEAARTIMAWNLPRELLWTALALVAAMNTFVIQLVLVGAEPSAMIPSYFQKPLALFVLMAGVMVIYIHALYWAGLAIGGKGRLDDLLAVLVWLQILRTGAQLAIIVVSLAVPSLGMLVLMAVTIWGFWILLNFIATTMNLPTPLHGLVVLVIGLVGLVLSVSIVLALVGVGGQGALTDV